MLITLTRMKQRDNTQNVNNNYYDINHSADEKLEFIVVVQISSRSYHKYNLQFIFKLNICGKCKHVKNNTKTES